MSNSARLLRSEFHFYDLVSFARGRLPLPLTNRVSSCLRKDWRSTLDLDRFDSSVCGNKGIDFDHALQGHLASKLRVGRSRVIHKAALRRFLSMPAEANEGYNTREKHEGERPLMQQRFHPSQCRYTGTEGKGHRGYGFRQADSRLMALSG